MSKNGETVQPYENTFGGFLEVSHAQPKDHFVLRGTGGGDLVRWLWTLAGV